MGSDKSKLLYISPTIPASAGNGRAMRAYNIIRHLSLTHQIHLLIISREIKSRKNAHIDKEISALCDSIQCIPIDPRQDIKLFFRVRLFKMFRRLYYRLFGSIENLYCSPKMIRSLQSLYRDISFDIIHVFRIYMTGFAECYIASEKKTLLQLDLDDIESKTHYRLSELYKLNRHKIKADKMRLDADSYQKLEHRILQSTDRVFVCSDVDKNWLADKYDNTNIRIVPNIVDIPENISHCHTNERYRFLFIGTFGYYPNYEGIVFFCRNILPDIRKQATRSFEICIVGTGITKSIASTLNAIPDVTIIGPVEDITPQYVSADAMIVPVRAGGGTRIKVLESFAHQCPVISTKFGVEGIAGRHEEHFLSSESDKDFAQHCLRLMDEPCLARSLAANAFNLVKTMYAFDALKI